MPEEASRMPRIEKLTSSIREMASRVNAEFVPDNRNHRPLVRHLINCTRR